MINGNIFYIFDGNKVVDVIIGKDRIQQAEITLDYYKNRYEDRWINYELITLEAKGELNQVDNVISTVLLNGRPIVAYINTPVKDILMVNDEYRKYTYRFDYDLKSRRVE